MKRVLIGGFFSLLGTLWGGGVLAYAITHLTDAWRTPPGRVLTTIAEQHLLPVFVIALVLVGAGLGILVYEFFHKEKKQ